MQLPFTSHKTGGFPDLSWEDRTLPRQAAKEIPCVLGLDTFTGRNLKIEVTNHLRTQYHLFWAAAHSKNYHADTNKCVHLLFDRSPRKQFLRTCLHLQKNSLTLIIVEF